MTRCRPTVPVPGLVLANRHTSPVLSADTPAVAYDGDLEVSQRTPASGLVRRADAAPGNSVDDPDVAQGTAVPS